MHACASGWVLKSGQLSVLASHGQGPPLGWSSVAVGVMVGVRVGVDVLAVTLVAVGVEVCVGVGVTVGVAVLGTTLVFVGVGVVSGALDPGVGVDPDDVLAALGLPREDAINENARRLADIAKNGLTGQDWLGDFANEVPDIWRMIRTASNPQEEAAYLLRDFQDGLLSSAIDKDKAKEIVKRQIMGDQNMAALAEEIARELAEEMGVPMQQALAAAQGTIGGGGGMLGVGGESALGFTDGATMMLDESGGGAAFVDKFVAQMRGNFSALKTAGIDGGKQWGDGFMSAVGDNVPPQLIGLLVSLVTPGVMAQFAQQGSLTGAES